MEKKAYLFTTNKNVKILVCGGESENVKNVFKTDGISQLSGSIESHIQYIGEYEIDNEGQSKLIDLLRPDIVINLVDKDGLVRHSDNYVYFSKSITLKELKKYFSFFLLIDQIKSIKSQLSLN